MIRRIPKSRLLDSKKCLQKINVISNIQINKAVDPDFNADANGDLDIISKIQLNEAIEAAKKLYLKKMKKKMTKANSTRFEEI
jgi:hypothetical protein